MPPELGTGELLLRLGLVVVLCGALGLEREARGREAGLRTHILVGLGAALFTLVSAYGFTDFAGVPGPRGTSGYDPTRIAAQVVTGIGFLGAGVIMKEGLSVRGLTTAASIWMTAAIGILIGIGFYFPAAVATALTIAVLSLFHWIEARLPAQFYAQFAVRFAQDAPMAEEALRELVSAHGFSIANLNYRFDAEAGFYEYQMVIRSTAAANAGRLAMTLSKLEGVLEFRLSPTGR